MSDLDELLKQIPLDDIAAQLGVKPEEADAAVKQAVPALLQGLQTTAETGGGTADLQAAVDDDDGDKIVASLFGEKTDDVAHAVSGQVPAAAIDQGLVKQLLPIIAPIVIAYVLKKVTSGNNNAAPEAEAKEPPAEKNAGGVLGEILSGALGGGSGGGSNSGGALGSILGGLLGGGSSSGGGGALGSILGGLLGGKK